MKPHITMLGMANISATHWIVFVVAVLVFLALDLGVFHRKAHVVRFREAFFWTAVWFVMAMAFGMFIAPAVVPDWQRQQTIEFVTGYIIELSLSMDNVFVIAVIFTYFRVEQQVQHRVLFWGILGALAMRGAMIWAGVELIQHIKWMLYVLGAFLVFTGIRMLFRRDEGVHPEKNLAIRLAQRIFPVSSQFDGQKFITNLKPKSDVERSAGIPAGTQTTSGFGPTGQWALTPMALVLLMVETTDLIFAMDSIPAIFAVTLDPFIVFTSNVFAILGLRSLYFVLAGAIDYFRYLPVGLSVVLIFIGAKMLLMKTRFHISTQSSLVVVAAIIFVSIVASIVSARYGRKGSR